MAGKIATASAITLAVLAALFLRETKVAEQPEEKRASPAANEEANARAYERAFNKGFDAFMKQYGIPQKTWTYTSQETREIGEVDEEKIFMGYADGYHAAAKAVFGPLTCTR